MTKSGSIYQGEYPLSSINLGKVQEGTHNVYRLNASTRKFERLIVWPENISPNRLKWKYEWVEVREKTDG